MKKTIVLLLCLALTLSSLCVFPVSATAEGWDGETASTSLSGSGTEEDPYLIQTPEDLHFLREIVNGGTDSSYREAHYKQTANLDLNGQDVAPIGPTKTSSGNTNFKGVYDGGNFTVSNFKVSTGAFAGLFGIVYGATIKNVNVDKATVTGTGTAAGIVVCKGHRDHTSTVENCTTTADCYLTTAENAAPRLGGVVGYAYGTTVSNCINRTTVVFNGSGAAYVGGITSTVGMGGSLENCINFGSVIIGEGASGTVKWAVGGIVGLAGGGSKYGSITNCYNAGTISCEIEHTATATSSTFGVGGIAGENNRAQATITDCYNMGTISAHANDEGSAGTIVGMISYHKSSTTSNKDGSNYNYGLAGGNTDHGYGVLANNVAITNSATAYNKADAMSSAITKSDETETTLGAAIYAIYAKVCNAPARRPSIGKDLAITYDMIVDDLFIGENNTLAVEFTMKDTTGETASATVAHSEKTASKYSFRFEHLAPQVIGEAITISLKVVDGEGKDVYTLYTFTDSIKAYLMQVIKSAKQPALLKTLASDLLVYGQAIHDYLGATEIAKVLDGTEEGLTSSNVEVPASAPEKSASSGVSKFVGAGVRVGNTNKMYFTFTPDTTKDVTVKINNMEVEATDLGNGTWVVYTPGVSAANHGDNVTAELFENGESVQTLAISINNYAYAMKDHATMKDVATALYRYGASAAAYAAAYPSNN